LLSAIVALTADEPPIARRGLLNRASARPPP
jgi:hypothetical protein